MLRIVVRAIVVYDPDDSCTKLAIGLTDGTRRRVAMMGSQVALCGVPAAVEFNGPIGKLTGPSAEISLFDVGGSPPKELP